MRRLVERGYREVVLTGVDLTSYGAGLPGAPTLGRLVQQILKHVPELARLRLSSIDSVEADRDLLDALAEEARLMPHLHLSLQAGDDLILKRMKRRHSARRCHRLLPTGAAAAARHGVRRRHHRRLSDRDRGDVQAARSISSTHCGLTYLHVFPFSPRPGTPAARMPQVTGDAVKERARQLRERGAAALRRHLDSEVGTVRRVLAESHAIARTEQFTQVQLAAPAATGVFLDVAIANHDGRRLRAA